jgi:predicted ATPase
LGEEDLVEWPDGTVTAQYRFRHALYQEVLYGHLSPARRVAVHRRIGERLAAGFGPRAGEIAAELAVHFERGRDYEQAIRFLARAAETALQRLAHREALDYADRGLQLLERTGSIAGRPAVELRLRMMKVVALVTLEGYGAPAVDVAYQQARAVCAEIDDPTLLGPVLYGLRSYASARGRMDDADELVAELHRLAQRHPDPVLEMQAHHAAGADDGFAGRQASALAHFERCLELYDPATHRQLALVYGEDPGVASHHYSAFVNWFLGYPDRARRHATAACRLARDLGYPNDIVLATTRAAFVQIMCGDVDRAQDLNGALLEMCQQHDLARWWAYWKVVDGWALGRRDEPAKAVAQMRDGLTGLSAAGAMLGAPFFAALLAELLADLGDTAAAHETTAAALDATSRTGHHWYDAELIRLQGELRLRTDGGAGAETAFENAIAVARQQQARSFELRAVTSLARLWKSRGDGDRAREVLAETYRSFGEGHDTHDLRAAAALMADLG